MATEEQNWYIPIPIDYPLHPNKRDLFGRIWKRYGDSAGLGWVKSGLFGS